MFHYDTAGFGIVTEHWHKAIHLAAVLSPIYLIFPGPARLPGPRIYGVPPLAAHLFILYYGILADLTPPVCVSADAAAGIAGANPFRTGLTACRLGLGKAIVPFVFAYAR